MDYNVVEHVSDLFDVINIMKTHTHIITTKFYLSRFVLLNNFRV